ncbi:MAG: dephospho-CoA kinase [Pseudomonadota bacterium]
MKKLVILLGLTGSFATGKSLISSFFKKHNIALIDADQIAKDITKKGSACYKAISETFGKKIFFDDGQINRKKLRRLVFNDQAQRKKLEAILHPAIRSEIITKIEIYKDKKEKLIVIDAPLLFENGLNKLMDKTIVVFVDEKTQLIRTKKRDKYNARELKKIIDSQMPISDKIKLADYLIDNSGSIDNTYKKFMKVLEDIEKLL